MIGHLQTNKVKLIAPFVALIHSADSERLIRVINDEAIRNGRVIDILLEIHVADEETKSGWTYDALLKYVKSGALAAMKGRPRARRHGYRHLHLQRIPRTARLRTAATI